MVLVMSVGLDPIIPGVLGTEDKVEDVRGVGVLVMLDDGPGRE